MTTKYISGQGSVELTAEEEVEYAARHDAWVAAAPQRAFDAKKQEIDDEFIQSVEAVKNGYTQEEINSWPVQEREARAIKENPANRSPFLDALGVRRGVDRIAVADGIIAKADAYADIVGTALGRKKVRLAALEAIDLDAAEAVSLIEGV